MANLEIFDLALLLLGAKTGGIIFHKLHQPSLAGELLAGIVLGSSILKLVNPSQIVEATSQLGLMFLVLLTTLAIDWSKVENKVESYSMIEIIMAIIVMVITFFVGNLLKWNFFTSVVVALAMMQSSLAIASRTLANIGELNSKEGEAIIGFQVVNDIVAILSIAVVANFLQNSTLGVGTLAKMLFIVVGFVVVMSKTGLKFTIWLTDTVQKHGLEDTLLGLTLVLSFSLATFTEKLGLESFLGVFLAGLLLSKTPQASVISGKVKEVGEAFFIPIFFASIGLGVDVMSAYQQLPFIISFALFAIAIKMISYAAPLAAFGYSGRESLRIGSGMVSVSEMSLIILSIGLAANAFDVHVYSMMIAIFLIIDVVSPIITSMFFRDKNMPSYPKRSSRFGVLNKGFTR
ncbi:MAG: cation:proton antiporter [Candidatus Aenigmatarchaeota archaeon]